MTPRAIRASLTVAAVYAFFLIFAGIYLMISMTSAILREQVTG